MLNDKALYKIKLHISLIRRVLSTDSMLLRHKLEIVRYIFFSPHFN